MTLHSARNWTVCSLIAGVLSLSAPAAHAAETTNLHDHKTIAPLQLLDGQYEGTETSAKCVELRAKLVVKRTALKTSKEWRKFSSSPAYKSFEESHSSLKSANCTAGVEASNSEAAKGTATGAAAEAEVNNCSTLTSNVTQHADALATSKEWKSLTKSKSWNGLFSDFAKAEKEGCIKPAPNTVGVEK